MASDSQNISTAQGRNSKFLKDMGIYAIGNLGSKAITFLMVPLYTYFVERPADFGYYDICLTAIFLLIPFVTLQLRDGAFRFLLDADSDQQRDAVVTMVGRTMLVQLCATAAIAVALGCLTDIPYLAYTVALLMAMSLQEVLSQTVRGLGNNKAFVAIGIISALGIGVLSVIFVAMLHWGIRGIFVANILARLLALAVIELRTGLLRRHLRWRMPLGKVAGELLRYSLPLLPASLCWWVTGSSDRWFIQHFLGYDSNGIYAVAFRFTSLLQTLALIYYQAWQETAILQWKSPDRDGFFSRMFNSYIYVLVLIMLGYTFMLKINYSWLVDDNYHASVWYVYPLAVSQFIFAVAAFFDMGYQCAKDTARTLPAIVAAAVVNVGLNLALTPLWGIRGVMATSIISYTVLLAWRWSDMRRYFVLTIERITLLPLAMIAVGALAYYLSPNTATDIACLAVLVAVMLKWCPPALRQELLDKARAKLQPKSRRQPQ